MNITLLRTLIAHAFTLGLLVGFLHTSAWAGPTLKKSDLVVVHYQQETPDTCVLLALADIPASSVVFMTDAQWLSDGNLSNNQMGNTEMYSKWTSPSSVLPAGTLIRFGFGAAGAYTVNHGTIVAVTASIGEPLAVAGDQMVIFQTTDDNSTFSLSSIQRLNAAGSPEAGPIYSFSIDGGNNSFSTIENGWGTVGNASTSNGITTAGSFTPPNSVVFNNTDNTNRISANAFGLGGFYVFMSGNDWDNVRYVGAVTSTDKAGWLVRVHTVSNWEGTEDLPWPSAGPLDALSSAPVGGGATAPTVTTPTSTSVTHNSAILGGNVTSDGGDAITERGVVYSPTATNNNPQIGGTGVVKVTASGTTGVFTANVSSLSASTGYSFAAYATNSVGTSYSSVGTFMTSSVSATIIFGSTTNISGTVITDGQGGSFDVPGVVFQFSAKGADGTTELPMTYQPNIYSGVNGIAGGYLASSIQSVFTIKSSSQSTNFTMSSILLVDYGGVDGDLLRIEGFDNGVSNGFITTQVSGDPWYATVDLASLGGTKFVDIDEVRITGNNGVDMYVAVNNVTVSDITTTGGASVAVNSLNRTNATPTNQNTVNWTLSLDGTVTGVTASNFSLSGVGASGASIGTPSTGNGGLSWTVPVTTGSDGILTLSMANATGLSATISTTLPYEGQGYTVDKTPPTTSLTGTPSALTMNTGATFTYSGADTGGTGVVDYEVSLDGSVFASAGSSGTSSYLGLSDGDHTFQVRAVDAVGNVDATPASFSWKIDTTPPMVQSVMRLSPAGQTTNSSSVTFRVTYSEAVTISGDAKLRYVVMPVNGSTITGTIAEVSGTGNIRDVTVNITGGTGEFRLRVLN